MRRSVFDNYLCKVPAARLAERFSARCILRLDLEVPQHNSISVKNAYTYVFGARVDLIFRKIFAQ